MLIDLYELETVPDGGGDGGAAVAEAEPAAEEAPAVEPAAEGDPGDEDAGQAPEAPAGWSPEDPGFRQAVAEEAQAIMRQELAQLFQAGNGQPEQGQPQGFDWSQIDPYGDDFGQQLGQGFRAEIAQALDQSLGPVTQTLEQAQIAQAEQRGEEVVQDVIAAEIAAGDDLTDEAKQALRPVFDPLLESYAQRYGATPRTAEMAAKQAVDLFRQIEKAAASRALAQHTNHTATLAGVRSEPGTGTGGVAGMDTNGAAAAAMQGRTSLAQKYGTN